MDEEVKRVYDHLVEQYKLMADDEYVEWDEAYEKFALDMAHDIVDEVNRYRQYVIEDNLSLTDLPWEV